MPATVSASAASPACRRAPPAPRAAPARAPRAAPSPRLPPVTSTARPRTSMSSTSSCSDDRPRPPIHQPSCQCVGRALSSRPNRRNPWPARLAANIRHLREARGLTQEQMARLAGLPRATWGHLETGGANPTLARPGQGRDGAPGAHRGADLRPPRRAGRLYPKATLKSAARATAACAAPPRSRSRASSSTAWRSRRAGASPACPTCRARASTSPARTARSSSRSEASSGRVEPGDVLVFRGDQRHSYRNPGRKTAVGYSVVLLTR